MEQETVREEILLQELEELRVRLAAAHEEEQRRREELAALRDDFHRLSSELRRQRGGDELPG